MTEPDGSYTKGGLGDGAYLVSFFDSSGVFQSGFHDASGLVLTHGEADPVVLTGTGAVVDAALPDEAPRTVEGTVTNIADQPVGGILLTAQSAYFPMSACSTSLSDGTYAVDMRTMAFRLHVTDFSGAYPSGFYSELAPGHFTTSYADASILTAESDLTGVDIQFPELYTLSGTVGDGSAPVGGISLSICLADDQGCRSASSAEDGTFTASGLVAGTYTIAVFGGGAGYLNGYYSGQGAFSRDKGDAASVVVDDDVSGLQLLVVLAPTATGTVTNTDGDGLGNIYVSLSSELDGAYAYTNPDGTYTTTGLQPGTYTLQVSDQNFPPAYPTGYLGDNASFVVDPADAAPIVVDLNDLSNLADVDVVIPYGGSMEVSVISGGSGVPDAPVQICSSEFQCEGAASTDGTGAATISALLPGSYYVQATADYEHFYWYVSDGAVTLDFGAASAVSVSANATAQITMALPSPGAETPACVGDECEPIPLDDGTGATPVELTFENVETGGTTSLTIPPEPPTTPAGFQFGEPPTYYEITTTAILADGSAYTICVTFDPADFDDPGGVRLFHFASDPAPGAWENITLPGYPVGGTVCGSADSLSPFALVEPAYSFGGFFGAKAPPQVNEAKAGAVVGIQFSLGADIGLSIFLAGSPTVERVDCATGATIGGSTVAASGSPALKFNNRTERYTFQWQSDKAWKNTCQRLVLTFKDESAAEVIFHFKK